MTEKETVYLEDICNKCLSDLWKGDEAVCVELIESDTKIEGQIRYVCRHNQPKGEETLTEYMRRVDGVGGEERKAGIPEVEYQFSNYEPKGEERTCETLWWCEGQTDMWYDFSNHIFQKIHEPREERTCETCKYCYEGRRCILFLPTEHRKCKNHSKWEPREEEKNK